MLNKEEIAFIRRSRLEEIELTIYEIEARLPAWNIVVETLNDIIRSINQLKDDAYGEHKTTEGKKGLADTEG